MTATTIRTGPRADLVEAIDAAVESSARSEYRYHLGASVVGRPCVRETWYRFWWWHAASFPGRVLRLFDRGHREEPVVRRHLEALGAEVTDACPRTGSQYGFSRLFGLYGGSTDGLIVGGLAAYDLPGRGLYDAKTHNARSFRAVSDKGVARAKPEHYAQLQVYMCELDVEWSLYYAVCKDDDTLYCEVLRRSPEAGEMYAERALRVISSYAPPARVSDDPTWFQCRFCDFHAHCHGDAEPARNCRTCSSVRLVLGEETGCAAAEVDRAHAWFCTRWGEDVPADVQRTGCDAWSPRRV